MTEAAMNAMSILRSTDQASWSIIPLIFIAGYVYAVEVQRKSWDMLLFAVGAMMVWFQIEVANALVLHFTGYSSPWICSTNTSYLIFIGFNIEILLAYFAIGIMLYLKILPEDRKMKILGIPNRLSFPIGGALFCFLVELFMNKFNLLIWDYTWWVYIVFPGYLLIFFIITGLYDHLMPRLTLIQKFMLGGVMLTVDIATFVIFALILKWI
jgi:hypothetical protein